jgi:hypothetical protein
VKEAWEEGKTLGIEGKAMESGMFWVMHTGKKLNTVFMAVGWNCYVNWKGLK